jgi:8-oxo-dGTP diphosphatase
VTRVYLVRHAKALDRASWQEQDDSRPLSKAGRLQATALPAHFDELAFAHLVSSRFLRCVQTLEPLSERIGLAVELAEELVEGASGRGALDLVLALAADGTVAACTHGDVLLDALLELRGERVPIPGPLECKKGSAWVLEVEGGEPRSAAYLPPPAVKGTKA